MVPLGNVPTVISAISNDVDLFPFVLTDVTDPEFTGDSVEGESPRVSEPVGVDFGTGIRRAIRRRCERVVTRDSVVFALSGVINVDSDD